MLRTLARWRPRHLLLAWAAWWIGLALVALGPALPLLWRITRNPDLKGEANAGYGDGRFTASLSIAGEASWSGSIGFGAAVLWIVVPPLVLWLLWLAATARHRRDSGLPA